MFQLSIPFVDRGEVLSSKLSQGYCRAKLVSAFKMVSGRHHDLVSPYTLTVSNLFSDLVVMADNIVWLSVSGLNFHGHVSQIHRHDGCFILAST